MLLANRRHSLGRVFRRSTRLEVPATPLADDVDANQNGRNEKDGSEKSAPGITQDEVGNGRGGDSQAADKVAKLVKGSKRGRETAATHELSLSRERRVRKTVACEAAANRTECPRGLRHSGAG